MSDSVDMKFPEDIVLTWCDSSVIVHEGHTMRKIMGNKPQVSSAIIIQSSANILEWPSAPGSDCWCFYN
jgi:hypothetical protein